MSEFGEQLKLPSTVMVEQSVLTPVTFMCWKIIVWAR